MDMEVIHFLLRIILAYLGAVGGYMGLSLLWRLQKQGEKAMASFQLNPEDAIEDFKILLAAQAFMIIGFFLYAAGGSVGSELMLNIGRSYAVIFALLVLDVFYRWWVRF